jgi:MFS family permease
MAASTTEAAAVAANPLVRDVRIVGLIGAAHFLSHFFQLVVPPLFPLLKAEFGVSYTDLGFAMTLFYASSGLTQAPSGFLVDRFGARRVLVAGLSLLAGMMLLVGFAPSYWALLPLLVLAGIGNSVFHPADFAILTAGVSPSRLGRAYGAHVIGGNLGWTAAPLAMTALVALLGGWRAALVAVGVLGLGMALVLLRQKGILGEGAAAAHAARGPAGARRGAGTSGGADGGGGGGRRYRDVVLSAPILLSFAYFALLAVSLTGLQTFLPTALVAIDGVSLETGGQILSLYLFGSSAGVLAGGFLADRMRRHELVVAGGLLCAAALLLTVGVGGSGLAVATTGALIALAGFTSGITTPSRDLLVRSATPKGAAGRVFGFVYSGLDLGSAVTPPIIGMLLDHGMPRAMFVMIASVLALAILTAILLRRSAPPPAPAASAGAVAAAE